MFFEAYRNNAQKTTKIGLSSTNGQNFRNSQSWENIYALNNTIHNDNSYIMLATRKFGETLRKSVEIEGGKSEFYKNPEYVRLKKYFKNFGYKDIDLKCIDTNDNIYQFFITKNKIPIEIDLISSGEREIVNFIFGLFLDDVKDGIVIIDEPELHIHPNWQKKLIDILKTETSKKNVQLFFVTHSPSFIKYDVLNNIFRIYMDNQDCSHHIRLNVFNMNKKEIRDSLNMINATNNEKIFFSKAIILVEGITDRILFEKLFDDIMQENRVDVEIININGKTNYDKFAGILNKLKIPFFYIGDRDNLKQYSETKKYFVTNKSKVINTLKDADSNDYENLVNSLDQLIATRHKKRGDIDMVIDNYKKICLRKLDEKKLTDDDIQFIDSFINKMESQNIYILKKGEIEQYIGVMGHNKQKSLETAILLTTDSMIFDDWKENDTAIDLYEIVKKISNKILEKQM